MRFDLAEGRAQLERTPSVIRALLEPLPESWQHATEGPGTWSPLQVLRHLLWGEVNDWSHLTQITRTLARQYRADGGPWIEFMRVLKAEG